MKFLHTADWQIGMKAAHVGEAGPRVREERLAAARRVIEAARRGGADFVLVAGDTFEDNGVDRVLVQRVIDTLASFPGPVYVLPGNHDPLGPGSVWEHPAWRSAPHVTVLRESRPLAVPGGTLFPCPALAKHSDKDPTAWIDARTHAHAGVRVGVAHGTVEGVAQDEPDYPIARDAVTRAGVDYLALGHFHSTATYRAADGAVRTAYSGTPETTRFGERDSGHVLLVDVPAPGDTPVLTQVRTGGLAWRVLATTVRESGDLTRLREQIEALADPGSTLLQVRVDGLLPAGDHEELGRIGDVVASRFLHGRVSAHELLPSPRDDAWVSRLPAGAVREAAARLRDLADPEFPGPRPDGATAEIAAWALLELYELVADVPG
jgi:DNA repair exonuclease SbcCD nuclease subunit